jgi:hypothetical protein
MDTQNFSKSVRTHIRREKARIRRDIPTLKEQDALIGELYSSLKK